ncbi:MAG: hypothetical protein J5517_04850 [Eubacterium sp.]|nr:hypothetical protein [Eubacterium sp.]
MAPKKLSTRDKINNLNNTYSKQYSLEDRMYFMMLAAGYDNSSVNDKNKQDIPQDERFPEELRDSMGELKAGLYKEMLGDGSLKTIKESYRKLGYILTRAYIQMGMDYEDVLKTIPKDDPQRENKAAYLVYSSDSRGKYMYAGYQELLGLSGISNYISFDEEAAETIGRGLNFSKNMSVEAYFKALDKNDKELEEFCKANNCNRDFRYFDVFSKTAKEKDPNITDEQIIKNIITDYTHEFVSICDNYSMNITHEGLMDVVSILPENEKKLFQEGHYIQTGSRPVDDDPNHDISIMKGDNVALGKSVPEQDAISKKITGFTDWINKEGKAKADELSSKNADAITANFEERLFSGKNMGARDNALLSEIYKKEIINSDPSFLNGVYHDLENSAKGTKHKNTIAFDKMVNTLREYTFLVKAGSGGTALDKKQDLIKDCLSYIGDKMGRVRTKAYGQKRFDDALLILSDIMPEKDFRNLIGTINAKRGAKPGNSNYIDYDKTYKDKYAKGSRYSELRQEERAREDLVQKSTLKNSTKMIPRDEQKVAGMDKKFGKGPDIKTRFEPIGPFREAAELSNKDFAAIAYAASFTSAVMNQDSKNKSLSPEKKLVKYGREYAENALKAYQSGMKEPLAKILQEGVKNITTTAKNQYAIDDATICNNEMLGRISNMMDRDPELMRLAFKNGMKKSDIDRMKAVNVGADIVTQYKKSMIRLLDGKYDTKEQRTELVTDVVFKSACDMYLYGERDRNKKPIVRGSIDDLANPKIRNVLRDKVKEYVKKSGLEDKSAEILKDPRNISGYFRSLGEITRPILAAKQKAQPVRQNAKTK